MTGFVTREEYDKLAERLNALEAKQVAVNFAVSDVSLDEKVAELVRRGISQGWQEFERSLAESQRRGAFDRMG